VPPRSQEQDKAARAKELARLADKEKEELGERARKARPAHQRSLFQHAQPAAASTAPVGGGGPGPLLPGADWCFVGVNRPAYL